MFVVWPSAPFDLVDTGTKATLRARGQEPVPGAWAAVCPIEPYGRRGAAGGTCLCSWGLSPAPRSKNGLILPRLLGPDGRKARASCHSRDTRRPGLLPRVSPAGLGRDSAGGGFQESPTSDLHLGDECGVNVPGVGLGWGGWGDGVGCGNGMCSSPDTRLMPVRPCLSFILADC